MSIELKKIRKSLIYAAQAPVANIVAELHEIAEFDTLAALKQKEYGRKALYYFLGIIGSIILIVIIANSNVETGFFDLVILLLLLALPILTIAWIYALIMRYKFRPININDRYEVTEKVLQLLARDIEYKALVNLQLSFQSLERKENKINTTSHPYKSGWKIDHHQHKWLKIQGIFLDKTRFELTATGISKKQYGWKRGSSGKNKYKSKIKSGGLDINLSLTFPQRRYGAIKILKNQVNDAVKLPNLSDLRGLKVTDKSMQLDVRIAPQMTDDYEYIYETITAMFLSLYQVLNLAKMLSK